MYQPAVLIPKFCCSPRLTNCHSSLSFSSPPSSSLSSRATSGFIEAVFMTGPMTSGKYGAKPGPRILQILAQALIMYDTCGSSSDISDSPVCDLINISMTSAASGANFSDPTANPMREMHSMVFPLKRRSSVVVAF